MISITNEKDAVFGNLVKLSNGIVELKVAVDFGPRVLHFSRVGMENVFYQDTKKEPLGDIQEIYGGDIMRLYGGHRIWTSPEVMPSCYYPDNAPVMCTPLNGGMEFVAPMEKINNIQKILTISLLPDRPVVQVENSITNCGTWGIELAPWCITMTDKGGKMVVPQPDRSTRELPNRNISLWPYSAMNDPRVYWGKDFIMLKQDPSVNGAFKFGFNNEAGWAAVFNKGQVFFKFFEPILEGIYPDGGCSFEAYTNSNMLEVEALGEFVHVPSEESVTLLEEWELYEESYIPSENEEELHKVLENYIV